MRLARFCNHTRWFAAAMWPTERREVAVLRTDVVSRRTLNRSPHQRHNRIFDRMRVDSSRVSCPGPGCGKRFNLLNRRHHCRLAPLLPLRFCVLFGDCYFQQVLRQSRVRRVCTLVGAREQSLLCAVLQQLQWAVIVNSTHTLICLSYCSR